MLLLCGSARAADGRDCAGASDVVCSTVGQVQAVNDAARMEADAKGGANCPKGISVRLPRWLLVQGQSTLTEMAYPAYHSPYSGAQSLDPKGEGRETFDATMNVGVQPRPGTEIWGNFEIDQGFGPGNTFGVAGYPSGEAFKMGSNNPYVTIPRLFLRQTINLGERTEKVDPSENQFGGAQASRRLVLTIGKIMVTDIFDNNPYAHDARNDFLNWSLIDAGTFDFGSNSWGSTAGAVAELYWDSVVIRAGIVAMSTVPNGPNIDLSFANRQYIAEGEKDFKIGGRAGAIRVTAFLTQGEMGSYAAAVAQAAGTGQAANTANVRGRHGRPGVSLNLSQAVSDNCGVFARLGWANGAYEAYDYTDIDKTASAGVSCAGARWGRPDDTLRFGLALNELSKTGYQYLNQGGMGIVVGDGSLRHPASEKDFELSYTYKVGQYHLLDHPIDFLVTPDLQLSLNPAYNGKRGPVIFFGLRGHAQF